MRRNQPTPQPAPSRPRRTLPGFDPDWLVILCPVAVLTLLACSALHLEERFVAQGDLIEVMPNGSHQLEGPVRVFLQTAPEGFDFIAGRPVVQPGYRHQLIGRIDLWVDRGICDSREAGHLSRDTVIERLRARAHQEGGDAVVYVRTRAEDGYRTDCQRVAEVGDSLFDQPWAEGWVALLERGGAEPEPTPIAPPVTGGGVTSGRGAELKDMADAGLADPIDGGRPDATLPNRPPEPSVPPPPPEPGPKPIPKQPPVPPEPAPGHPKDRGPAVMVPTPPPV